MRGLLQMLLVSAATFVAADTACAQKSFVSTPRDTIIAHVPLEAKRIFTFQQRATSANTLHLSWERIDIDLPANWEANLCDNGNCYPDLPLAGSMYPVLEGEYGLMALDIKPSKVTGTAVVRYRIWDTSNPLEQDTLTWIVHANTTGISRTVSASAAAFVVNKTLHIRSAIVPLRAVLYSITGGVVLSRDLPFSKESIDLSFLTNGIYMLLLEGSGFRHTQKISVGFF